MINEQLCYDKKKLIILRAALIAVGGAIGGLALWQYFVYYPDVVSREYRIVITVVSCAFTALLFGLSAKAFYRLGASIAGCVLSVNSKIGARGMIAVILSFIASGAVVMVFDIAIRTVWNIWAVRLLIDVLVYIVCCALFCYESTKWLNAPADGEDKTVEVKHGGYLLSADCFRDVRVYTAADALINVKVYDGAYKALALWDESGLAVKRLDELVLAGKVTVLRSNKTFSDKAGYDEIERSISAGKRLKFISADVSADGDMNIAMFAPPPESVQ